MKRTILVVLLALSLIYLIFNKEDKIFCSGKSSNNNYTVLSKYNVYYKNDEVYKIIIEEELEAVTTNILNEITEDIDKTYQKYKEEIGSYEYIIKKNKNKATTKITMIYSQMDMEAYKKYNPNASLNENNRYDINELKKLYEERGITCK